MSCWMGSLVMVGMGIECPDLTSRCHNPWVFFVLLLQRQTASWKYSFSVPFFFFFLSISSVPLSFQIKLSPRGLFLPGCVPQFLHSLWQAWGVFYLRRSPHMQEAYFFTGTFWDWPLLGLFTPCLFLLPLAQPLPHFRGFWGPLCKFLESVDYSCPGFTEMEFVTILNFAFVTFSVEVLILEFKSNFRCGGCSTVWDAQVRGRAKRFCSLLGVLLPPHTSQPL